MTTIKSKVFNFFFSPVLICFLLSCCLSGLSQQIAFPGAEGFGKYATGGRGGRVAEVINLDDDGPGSFRQALTEYPNDPITIVFKISGIIDLKTPLVIRRSNV